MIHHFKFGIYPGGMAGTSTGLSSGPQDDALQIEHALTQLQGTSEYFLIRAYIGYHARGKISHQAPTKPEQYLALGRKLDLVVCFQSEESNMEGWTDFIRALIHEYKGVLAKIQITEEANIKTYPLDGFYENSRIALVSGVVAAKEEIDKLGLSIAVGFNATPDFSPEKLFWKEIASISNIDFRHALDYVGIDFFPDVFRPIGDTQFQFAIEGVLTEFRKDIRSIGLNDSIPLHVTENGWPTTPERSAQRQAIVLEKIIRQVHSLRVVFNITHYELFSLRDADSKNPDLFHGFGIMSDDYKPKEAFNVFQKLISELTE